MNEGTLSEMLTKATKTNGGFVDKAIEVNAVIPKLPSENNMNLVGDRLKEYAEHSAKALEEMGKAGLEAAKEFNQWCAENATEIRKAGNAEADRVKEYTTRMRKIGETSRT